MFTWLSEQPVFFQVAAGIILAPLLLSALVAVVMLVLGTPVALLSFIKGDPNPSRADFEASDEELAAALTQTLEPKDVPLLLRSLTPEEKRGLKQDPNIRRLIEKERLSSRGHR